MAQTYADFEQETDLNAVFSKIISGLGALGVALQNYPAVELVMKGFISTTKASKSLITLGALASGGLCSGLVNYWMNVNLLNGFFKRMTSDKAYQYKGLTFWQQLQYFLGISIFVVTGLLFGLMAFTFALEGPFAILSIAAGVFVAIIMTIQEVETWLSSYDVKEGDTEASLLTSSQALGQLCGHVIAVGNVLALSFLLTLGMAQSLIMLGMAAFPALMMGTAIAFTFGAFTEYYFYDVYLANFCKNFSQKWQQMMEHPQAWLGLLCVSTNALVNAALTYAAVDLLTVILIAAQIALPPVAAMIVMAGVLAFFAGSASFILGLDFWIGSKPEPALALANHPSSFFGKTSLHLNDSGLADPECDAQLTIK
ncbi:MAG: hypothetical protein ACOYKA_04380 [Legionellaceae bacterium]